MYSHLLVFTLKKNVDQAITNDTPTENSEKQNHFIRFAQTALSAAEDFSSSVCSRVSLQTGIAGRRTQITS